MKCIICKKILNNYKIVHEKVRDDTENKEMIISCLNCNHIQLLGYRENLKSHYEKDSQSMDIVNNLKMSIKTIIKKEKVEIYRRIKKINMDLNHKKILDVGAGYCSFAKLVSTEYPLCNITSLEPSHTRTQKGVKINEINEKNIQIVNSYLDEKFVEDNKDKYDLVTLWHVLEHVDEKNIDTLLQNLLKVCKKTGKIIIEVPNANDELFKFEKYKNINYMIHHISYFTEDSLKMLLNNNKINSYKIDFVQRYGFKNYLNWIYKLGKDLKDDMYFPSEKEHENIWIEGKIKNKNTDALWVEIVI